MFARIILRELLYNKLKPDPLLIHNELFQTVLSYICKSRRFIIFENENECVVYKLPAEDSFEKSIHAIHHAHFAVTVWRNKGEDISAAC